jgi:hypothetical protein
MQYGTYVDDSDSLPFLIVCIDDTVLQNLERLAEVFREMIWEADRLEVVLHTLTQIIIYLS